MAQRRLHISVKVSAKMARLEFNGCDPTYIKDVCHARCCESSTSPTGTMISIHPSEAKALEARGAIIELNILQSRPGEKKCMFKDNTTHLCTLHHTPDKPFGCIASPFVLTKTKTLIVRNRYKLLRCYKDGPRLPAYVAFRASLDLLFGKPEAARICNLLKQGSGDVMANMMPSVYHMLRRNEDSRKPLVERGRNGR